MIERPLAGAPKPTQESRYLRADLWKKAPEATAQGDDLKELVKPEEENLRLRKLLADRLRGEMRSFEKGPDSANSR